MNSVSDTQEESLSLNLLSELVCVMPKCSPGHVGVVVWLCVCQISSHLCRMASQIFSQRLCVMAGAIPIRVISS